MAGSLHLFFTRSLPEFEEPAELLFIEDSDDDSALSELDAPDEHDWAYVTTLVSTFDDIESLRQQVQQWWHDLAGVPAELKLIADQAAQFGEDELNRLRTLREHSWRINTVFVAYRVTSEQGRSAAVQFILDESTIKH